MQSCALSVDVPNAGRFRKTRIHLLYIHGLGVSYLFLISAEIAVQGFGGCFQRF